VYWGDYCGREKENAQKELTRGEGERKLSNYHRKKANCQNKQKGGNKTYRRGLFLGYSSINEARQHLQDKRHS